MYPEHIPTEAGVEEWWLIPRFDRPHALPDGPEIERMATGLRSALLNAPERSGRALGHVIWAVATWARRRPAEGDTRIQVTTGYVQAGASVGKRAAELALQLFRRWTGAEASAGWLTVSPEALEATWRALDWARPRGLVKAPATPATVLEPLFPLSPTRPGRDRGKAQCGCGGHAHGDRDPSLAYDLGRGLATCQVSGEVFVLLDRGQGIEAHRVQGGARSIPEVPRYHFSGCHNNTPSQGVGSESSARARSEIEAEAARAGRPWRAPMSPGIVNGRLDDEGLDLRPSQSISRSSWAEWMARRWSGPAGEGDAHEAMAEAEVSDVSPRKWMPERFTGIGFWTITGVEWMEGISGRIWPEFTVQERGTDHVLLDLDRTDPLSFTDGQWRDLVERIRGALESGPLIEAVEWR